MGWQKARGTEGARGTKEPGAWQLCLVGPVDRACMAPVGCCVASFSAVDAIFGDAAVTIIAHAFIWTSANISR